MKRTSILAPWLVLPILIGCAGSAPPDLQDPVAAASGSASSAPVPTVAPSAEPRAAGSLPSRADLVAKAPDLERMPELDELEGLLGKPHASGKFTRRTWLHDPEKSSKGSVTAWHCPMIDVLRSPTGGALTDVSMMNSDECKGVKLKQEQVDAVLEGLAEKTFEEAVKAFESALGKPAREGEVPWSAWRYAANDGTCQMVLVTEHLGSKAEHVVWDLPCE